MGRDVEPVERRLGEPVVAAARFRMSRPARAGSGDWISALMAPVDLVMSRRDEDLPRHVVVAVTASRICFLTRSGREAAAWSRSHVQTSAQRSEDGWEVWVQPPGDRTGFELKARQGSATDAVVHALRS